MKSLAIGQEQITSITLIFFVYNSTSTSQTRANSFRRDRRHVAAVPANCKFPLNAHFQACKMHINNKPILPLPLMSEMFLVERDENCVVL